jgi:hypothetical protein
MKTDFTSLRNSIDSLVAVVENTCLSLIKEANEQRKELLYLHARMEDTREDLIEFGAIMDDLSVSCDSICYLCDDVTDKVTDALEGGMEMVPTCDYEELVGFCAECGDSIVEGETYDVTDDGYICDACVFERSLDEDEDEVPVESEQLSLDIPADTETVEEA